MLCLLSVGIIIKRIEQILTTAVYVSAADVDECAQLTSFTSLRIAKI